jgi:putative ABC transport system ATP-binding protein
VRLDGGSIHVAGHDITRWSEHQRARLVGRVFQDPRAGTAASPYVIDEGSLPFVDTRDTRTAATRNPVLQCRARLRSADRS